MSLVCMQLTDAERVENISSARTQQNVLHIEASLGQGKMRKLGSEHRTEDCLSKPPGECLSM